MWKGKKKSLFGPLELENFHFDVVNPQLSHAVTRHQRPKQSFFPFLSSHKPSYYLASSKAAQTNCSSSDYPFQGSGDMPPWVTPSRFCGQMGAVPLSSMPPCKKIFTYESHQVSFPLGMVLRAVPLCQWQQLNRWFSWDHWTAGRKIRKLHLPLCDFAQPENYKVCDCGLKSF